MSYRSSLSMDSGCISINSDPANQSAYGLESSSVYYSLPPSRKSSTTNTPYIPTTIPDTSDDEGCYPDAPTPQLSQSYASIPNLAIPSEPPPPKPPIRYRRRGLQPPRPRSLYSYPEENTVTVQPELSPRLGDSRVEVNCNVISDKLYRANKIFITPRPPSNLSTCSSMSSIPSCLRYAGRWSRPGSVALPNSPPPIPDRYHNLQDCGGLFTWEQVKRLLDPEFDNRTLLRHTSVNSKFANKVQDERTATGQNTVCSQEHIVVSRSVSSQSSDSAKLRKREKPWHESEHL